MANSEEIRNRDRVMQQRSVEGTLVEPNNMPVKNQQVNEDIKEEISKYIETNENKNTTFSWDTTKEVLRWNSLVIWAWWRNKKILNKQPNLPCDRIRIRTSKSQYQKERNKIREEISKNRHQKSTENSYETKR